MSLPLIPSFPSIFLFFKTLISLNSHLEEVNYSFATDRKKNNMNVHIHHRSFMFMNSSPTGRPSSHSTLSRTNNGRLNYGRYCFHQQQQHRRRRRHGFRLKNKINDDENNNYDDAFNKDDGLFGFRRSPASSSSSATTAAQNRRAEDEENEFQKQQTKKRINTTPMNQKRSEINYGWGGDDGYDLEKNYEFDRMNSRMNPPPPSAAKEEEEESMIGRRTTTTRQRPSSSSQEQQKSRRGYQLNEILPNVMLLTNREAEKCLPLAATSNQYGYFWGTSVTAAQRFAISLLGVVICSNISDLSLGTALQVPFATFFLWAPVALAARRNAAARAGEFVGLWRATIRDLEVVPVFARTFANRKSRKASSEMLVVDFIDDFGVEVELRVPYERRYEDFRPGDVAELLVSSDDDRFRNFVAVREAYFPKLGAWLGEYPFLDRTGFVLVSKRVNRMRNNNK